MKKSINQWHLPRKPVVLIVDASMSAWPTLGELKRGVREYCTAVSASPGIRLATLVVRDDAVQRVEGFVEAGVSVVPDWIASLRPKGHTVLGTALREALALLEQELAALRRCRMACAQPEIVCVTDGDSTDSVAKVAAEVARRIRMGELKMTVLGFGDLAVSSLTPFGCEVRRVADASDLAPTLTDFALTSVSDVGATAVQAFQHGSVVNLPPGSFVALDGTNIAGWSTRRGKPNLATTLAICRTLKLKRIPYEVWFDANFIHNLPPEDARVLESLFKNRPETFKCAPAGIDPRTSEPYKADIFVLQAVISHGIENSYYISNDLYRKEAKIDPQRFGWTQDRADRRICGNLSGDVVLLEPLGWRIETNK